MIETKRKKILVLGGTKHMVEAVKAVRRNGFSPVVVDNMANAPAKAFADQHFTFHLSDVKGLAKMMHEEKVAAIFTAFENWNIWNAVALCKIADLPFYTDADPSGFGGSENKFMEICESFNVSVMCARPLYTGYDSRKNATWGFSVMLTSADDRAGAEQA